MVDSVGLSFRGTKFHETIEPTASTFSDFDKPFGALVSASKRVCERCDLPLIYEPIVLKTRYTEFKYAKYD